MFRRLTPFALGAVLAVVLSLAGHTPARGQTGQPTAYALTDLASVPGFTRYYGVGINLSGQAAVSSARDGYTGHALFYNGATLVDLGVFTTGGYNQSQANAINNAG